MKPPAVIHVTAGHIANGYPNHAGACAIALAVREQCGNPGAQVWVAATIALWENNDCVLEACMPDEAIDSMHRLDDGLPVEPFEFAVEWTDQDGVGAS